MPSSSLPTRIRLRQLALSHFRNYAHARLEVSANNIVLLGENGAGKTNILEAISLLTPGRGLRKAALASIDSINQNSAWAISAEVDGMKGMSSIGTGRSHDDTLSADKRIVKIDGKIVRSQTELGHIFAALWLTPQMDHLFIEGGTARRKFLDRLVYSFDPQHASRINHYEQIIRDRNRLLQDRITDSSWLSALEAKMAEQAIAIAAARQSAVEGLQNATANASPVFPKASITLDGAAERLLQEYPALMAEEKLKALFMQQRPQDSAAGRALEGIHRTQIHTLHIEKNMAAEHCSTGEQKALLISIILAQARAGALWHGCIPVLLLDEVVTHLDYVRRQALFNELTEIGAQCWLTGTDYSVFQELKSEVLLVKHNTLSPFHH